MSIELHMLPVKAGDATLLIDRGSECPGTLLIDAGLADNEVVEYLRGIGVSHLDLVILSHPDLDRLQGLLALLEDPRMSVSAIWCFDLGFLREFVTTGKLRQPQAGTHRIQYERLLRSLVVDDQILKEATRQRIRCLQVSEGYRTNLGSLHLEVLYPWDGFYDGLRSPRALKKLLAKKWPEDWWPPEWVQQVEGELCQRPRARLIRASEQQRAALDELLNRIPPPESRVPPEVVAKNPLAGAEYDESEIEAETDEFPVSLLGTLFNNLSIVVRIFVTGGIAPPRLLFPGDLTDWTYLVARRWLDLDADVFKYPHHGSPRVGVSRRVLEEHGWPCPCPFWPCCTPRNWRMWRHFWEHLHPTRGQGACLFRKLVRPAHTLVFPYPQKGLPRARVLAQGLGTIHGNRESQALNRLADGTNSPYPRKLKIGEDRSDIAPM